MTFGSLKFSGVIFMLSGILHMLAPFFAKQGADMYVIGIIWIVLGLLLYREIKWLVWIVFLLAAFGVAGALTGVFGVGGWLMWLIALADFVTASSLFLYIWHKP